jgi:SAM-dependent methyltransferase
MFDTFMHEMIPDAQTSIVDVGVTPDRSLPESNFFEALYPFKQRLTATSIEDAAFLEQHYPGLTFVQTSGNRLPFDDNAFDVAVSFAVLEHVGDRQSQTQFVRELLRVGRMVYLTTPNRAFPIEFHTFVPFIHWLPQPLHQRLLRLLGLPFWSRTENLNLLNKGELLGIFPEERDVRIRDYRLLGFPSNLIAIINR